MIRLAKHCSRKMLGATVSKKILAISTFSSALTLGILSAMMMMRDISSFSKRKVEQLESMASIVGSNVEAALIFVDPITAEEYLTSLRTESDISEAILYNREGRIFALYQRLEGMTPPAHPTWLGAKMTENSVLFAQPVKSSSEQVGTLLLIATNTALKQHYRQSLLISLSVFTIGLFVTFLLSLGLQHLISAPLASLAQLAIKVSEDKDYSIRAKKLFNDEIGALVDGFNFMLENVQKRDEALNASHRDLEEKVADRTEKLQLAMEEAQAASKAKSEFLATMSHELRTPMNAIVGMASMLNDGNLDDERRGYVSLIRQSSDALLGLVNDVLDYSKIEAGRLELERKPFNLLQCAESAMNIVAAQRPDTQLMLFVSYDPDLPATIVGDTTRLRQILVNLLGNAVKFTENGYVWLRVSQQRDLSNKDKFWLKMEVRDTGIGIPLDRIDRLFQSFTQVDSSTTRKYGGTGLGLTISQKLADAMGGRIEVKSSPSQGSIFSVYTPLITSKPQTPLLGVPPWKANANPRIHIEGIEPPFVSCIEQMLKFWGARVTIGERNTTLQQDLLIKGVFDESLSELKATTQKAEQSNSTPCLYITKQTDWTDLRQFTKQPITTVPFNVEDLRANLTAILQQGANESEQANTQTNGSDTVNLNADKQIKILLVEDNLVNQKVFALMLKKMGFVAHYANNGEEAIEEVKTHPFDLLFMDYQMPVMDGIEATRQIRSMGESIEQPCIIGFTANVQKDTAEEMKKVGMDSYISKPVKFADLQKIIGGFMETKRG